MSPEPQFLPVLYPVGARWFAHLRPVQPGDLWHQPEERWTARVNADLDLIVQAPPERRGENLGPVDVRTLAHFQTGARTPLRLPSETPPPATAPCPVAGCRHLELTPTGSHVHERQLPIDPAQADRPYTCPCPRQAILAVALTARGWKLREHAPRQEYRAAHNAIAHALLTGQAYQTRRHAAPDTAADPNSARMEEAFWKTHGLLTQVRNHLLAGHLRLASDLAEQSLASEQAYRAHRRRYARVVRQDRQQGRWKNAETFWIDLAPTSESHQVPEPRRYTFQFIAVWDEAHGWSMANGDEIERASGLSVGPDAWAELIALLSRLESQPGPRPDAAHLIWERDGEALRLKRHIRSHYPRAVTALEALRLTLTPAPRRQRETPPSWTDHAPEWTERVLAQVDTAGEFDHNALNLPASTHE